ncbi:hypothetical protein JB92DRAFT_2957774 [Gautieria morchelliformis]|nr:hypothetical protein JB92DRAFT_2957774 [Gautieria morchelliformis]
MQSFTIILALAATGAMALSVRSPVPLSAPLRARQLDPSEMPTQCQTQCAPIVAELDFQLCTADICVCTTQVAADYQECLNCLASLGSGAAVTADVANAVSAFNSGCASISTHIPLITVRLPAPIGPSSAVTLARFSSSTPAQTIVSSFVPPAATQTAPSAGAAGAASASGAASATPKPSRGYGDATRLSWRALGALALVACAYLS